MQPLDAMQLQLPQLLLVMIMESLLFLFFFYFFSLLLSSRGAALMWPSYVEWDVDALGCPIMLGQNN